MKLILAILLSVVFTFTSRAAELDFGDQASGTLTVKAWKALDEKKYADAITFANKCVELFEKQALEMQKELKDFVDSANKDAVNKKWALNDVGTCVYIIGQANEKQEKKKEAIESYKKLIDKLGYAQCWDPQGWFWKPAEAAKERIAELEPAKK